MPHAKSSTGGTRKARWGLLLWPVGVLLAVGAAGLIWIWVSESPQRQTRIVSTLTLGLAVGALALAWFFAWLLAFSRLPWRTRLIGFAVAVLLLVAAGLSVEVRGTTGDVLPILAWRWSPEAGRLELPEAPAASPSAGPATAASDDYPQFLGPHRDATLIDVHLARDWAAAPPRLVWRQPIGAGWSGFAVSGRHAVTQEQRGENELVVCYDLGSGRVRWSHADRARFEEPISGAGPRATPSIDDGVVFALGATGLLNALDLESGELVWSRDIVKDNGGSVPSYGVSASPLVLGERVIVSAGGRSDGSLVAYDRRTGERVWAGGSDSPGYSSPRLAVLAGTPQILILNGDHLAAHDPDTGAVLWSYPWPRGTENVSQPVVLPDDRVFLSTGYGVGGKLFRVRRDPSTGGLSVDLLRETRGLKAKFTNVVHHEGHLYGLDDGILVCVDPDSGKRSWKRGRYGHGQILLVDDLLVVLGEDGTVALVEATAEAFRELGSFPAIEGKTWNHPALAGSLLLVRNDREAACYELPR